MKKLLFGAMIALTVLTACTDDDTENTNPDTPETVLNKTVTYFPAFENFVTRNVKYYDDNNRIVADSTYDNSGNFVSRKIHTVDSGNYSIFTKNIEDVTIATQVFQYDDQSRLTDIFGDGGQRHFTYDGDNITVELRLPVDVFVNVGVFRLNSDGYIVSQSFLDNDIITGNTFLEFSGNTKPVSLTSQPTAGSIEQAGTFIYYPNTVPADLEKSTVEINNEVLIANTLEASAMSCNYHLKDIMLGDISRYHSDIVFSPISGREGYPQYKTITIDGQPYCHIRYFFYN